MGKKRILLHACCASCATAVWERLAEEGWEVVFFFYNPNLYPPEEYEKRLQDFANWAQKIDRTVYFTENSEADLWHKEIRRVPNYENLEEGEDRCRVCFQIRLEKTASLAVFSDIPVFATTLTVSSHKDTDLINEIGAKIAEQEKVEFLARDFKKQEGFKRSVELSKKYNLYRQNYCGCQYSLPFAQ